MSLPKVTVPSFNETIPSNKNQIKIRQMLTKEEKILLLAKESNNNFDIQNAIKQVVNNCIIDQTNINDLAIFDMEYLFLKIRGLSVSNIVKQQYEDVDDKEIRQFDIDLNNITVKFPEKDNSKIQINEGSYIKLHYPLCSILNNKEIVDNKESSNFIDKVLFQCIESICIDSKVYLKNQLTEKDVVEWIDSCPIDVFYKINEFFTNLPHLYYKITYINKNNDERTIELSNIYDFFTWR